MRKRKQFRRQKFWKFLKFGEFRGTKTFNFANENEFVEVESLKVRGESFSTRVNFDFVVGKNFETFSRTNFFAEGTDKNFLMGTFRQRNFSRTHAAYELPRKK